MIKQAKQLLVNTFSQHYKRDTIEFTIQDGINALNTVRNKRKAKHYQYINEYYFNNDEKQKR